MKSRFRESEDEPIRTEEELRWYFRGIPRDEGGYPIGFLTMASELARRQMEQGPPRAIRRRRMDRDFLEQIRAQARESLTRL